MGSMEHCGVQGVKRNKLRSLGRTVGVFVIEVIERTYSIIPPLGGSVTRNGSLGMCIVPSLRIS